MRLMYQELEAEKAHYTEMLTMLQAQKTRTSDLKVQAIQQNVDLKFAQDTNAALRQEMETNKKIYDDRLLEVRTALTRELSTQRQQHEGELLRI